MDLEKGGRGAIERMVEAYGFTTRQALCDHLEVSKGTLANRYMRDSFPAEWVIQCALETKASLEWLTTGIGSAFENPMTDLAKVQRLKLIEGQLFDAGDIFLDQALLTSEFIEPLVIIDAENTYIAEKRLKSINDGLWLIDIDGKQSIRKIIRIPGEKVKVGTGDTSFDCLINDISFNFKIELVISKEGVNL
ncbi:phage repressor protein CI [Ewingella sp. S1.OA.A_B6]